MDGFRFSKCYEELENFPSATGMRWLPIDVIIDKRGLRVDDALKSDSQILEWSYAMQESLVGDYPNELYFYSSNSSS